MHGLTGGSWKRNNDRRQGHEVKDPRGNPAVTGGFETYRRSSSPRQLSTLPTCSTCGLSGGGIGSPPVTSSRQVRKYFTVGFEYQEDAQRFWADLRERFAKFGLDLHPDKTRRSSSGGLSPGDARRGVWGSRRRSISLVSRISVGSPRVDGSGCGITIRKRMQASYERLTTSSSGVGISPSQSKASGCEAW